MHVVVDIGNINPTKALTALKANATRQMRTDGSWPFNYTPWVEKGSKRYLWTEAHVNRAVDYVVLGQGDELPSFD